MGNSSSNSNVYTVDYGYNLNGITRFGSNSKLNLPSGLKNGIGRDVFDDIQGIGPQRKKILKKHFGTVENIKTASLEDLKQVKSIPFAMLKKIYEYFHST